MSHPLPRFFEALIDAIYCIPNLSIMRSCEINVQLSAIYIDMLLQIKFPEDGPKRQSVNGDYNCAQHRTFLGCQIQSPGVVVIIVYCLSSIQHV